MKFNMYCDQVNIMKVSDANMISDVEDFKIPWWDGVITRWDGVIPRWDRVYSRQDGVISRWNGIVPR